MSLLTLLLSNQGRGRPIGGGSEPVVVPWYLSGGVAAANCVAAFKPKGAASYAASKVNLITPGVNDAVDGAAFPTWAGATGWSFDSAASQYLTVGAAGATPITDNPVTMVCAFTAFQQDANQVILSSCDTVGNSQIALWIGGDRKIIATSDASSASTSTLYSASNPFVAAGVFAANNLRSAYLDGGGKVSAIDIIVQASIDTTLIGCRSWGGVVGFYYKGSIAACAFYNIALSDAQVLTISTAMVAL